MIIEHNSDGLITHLVFDPVPHDLFQVMDSNGITYLNFPPVQTEDGTKNVECDVSLDYIKDGQITRRPALQVPESVTLRVGETFVVTGLPDPINVVVDGQVNEITGGSLELDADMPAEYRLFFDKWPYQAATLKVTVNEA
ncbi:hypothetical protein C3Y94_026185 [Rhizobium ruizarguesonis]|uniref:hypothetical protein n=1 Tax=Rhizobium ruizarguesonis TaxID=2081791 RepID=UPI00163B32E0|nr:hypothetical protein [Rhizobium ruizarguesonis]MBC2806645.1 hypothetical protein [Rhizobium ruizarguesonis]